MEVENYTSSYQKLEKEKQNTQKDVVDISKDTTKEMNYLIMLIMTKLTKKIFMIEMIFVCK